MKTVLPEVRAALDALDVILAKQDCVSQELWNVLTALRGPDEGCFQPSKDETTTRIRGKAFPLTAAAAQRISDSAGWAYANGAIIDASHDVVVIPDGHNLGHFFHHARCAARDLGMTVDIRIEGV